MSVAHGWAAGEIAPLKSKASRRKVPVGQVVIDVLMDHLTWSPETKIGPGTYLEAALSPAALADSVRTEAASND